MSVRFLGTLLRRLFDRLFDKDRSSPNRLPNADQRALVVRSCSLLDPGPPDVSPADVAAAMQRLWAANSAVWSQDDAHIGNDIGIGGRLLASDPPNHILAQARIAEVIAGLEPLPRHVLMLSCRDDLDDATIAARLGLTQQAVRRELVHALIELDKALVDR
ncbi:sigma factor-like helix-turn-helix DNA-binding protein [Novosphingobium album (ex Liu et al. 2023)]|uniref:sigma factor-like helix-turn-helix DNA-binding protein n=1 Tax=Novosphingobium album (ex Liu et al. 2023) TaxID=3031130 RepID=UPI003D16B073